jgi:hypothetical protein
MKATSGLLIILATLISATVVRSQEDTVRIPRVELTGSFLYSMSSMPSSNNYEGETRSYTWAIQPGVAVLVVGYLEVGIEARYQQTRTETDYPGSRWQTATTEYTSTGTLVISIGPGYNLPLGPRIWLFAHLKAGLYWTANGWGSGGEESPKWSTNQGVFPVVQGGFKFFLSSRAAVIVQFQYDRLSEEKERTTTLGVGLAAYF